MVYILLQRKKKESNIPKKDANVHRVVQATNNLLKHQQRIYKFLTLSKKYWLRYNIYDTISSVNISFVNGTVQRFVHAKYKPWIRYTKQFKCIFYILYAQTFLKLKLCILLMHSTYMAYIFNDRNSTFWHALVPELRAYTLPSSILTALLSEKRQSTGMDM